MPHDVDFIRSAMGGGWLIVPDDAGRDDAHFIVESIMGEPDAPIMPLGGAVGWIVEPQDLAGIADALTGAGLWVEERA